MRPITPAPLLNTKRQGKPKPPTPSWKSNSNETLRIKTNLPRCAMSEVQPKVHIRIARRRKGHRTSTMPTHGLADSLRSSPLAAISNQATAIDNPAPSAPSEMREAAKGLETEHPLRMQKHCLKDSPPTCDTVSGNRDNQIARARSLRTHR